MAAKKSVAKFEFFYSVLYTLYLNNIYKLQNITNENSESKKW